MDKFVEDAFKEALKNNSFRKCKEMQVAICPRLLSDFPNIEIGKSTKEERLNFGKTLIAAKLIEPLFDMIEIFFSAGYYARDLEDIE